MALMVPNTEAMAVMHENSASEIMIAIDRFDILISPEEPRSGFPFYPCDTANRLKLLGGNISKEVWKQPELQPLLGKL